MLKKKIIIIVLFFFLSGASHVAFAGPDQVESIQITPAETTVGTHPEITGRIKADFVRNLSGILEINVVAVVVQPDHTERSWIWKNFSIEGGEYKEFTIPKDKFEVQLAGFYWVEFNVYTKDMRPLIRLTKSFVAIDPVRSTIKPTPQKIEAQTESSESKEAGNQLPLTSTRRYIGVGGFVNAVNFSAGPTVIFWPLKNIAIQGSYGDGTFTSYEIRGFYRFNMSSKINLYVGTGYFHAEKEFKVIVSGSNVEGKLMGNSFSVFGGAEVPLIKNRLALYIDVGGNPLKLSKDVTINSNVLNLSVDYSPVTIGVGLVYYLW
jgi:hypothetical protein